MGIIISRFRKKKSTLEVLEGLEKEIKSIEEYSYTTERQRKAVVGRLILFSVGLYVLTAGLFYFFFFPASLYDQLLYVIPLLLFPLIIIIVKRLVTWWYRRKLSRNQEKLGDIKKQKKELLEEVMDKETYKVAKEILEKFAPDQLRKGNTTVNSGFPGSRESAGNNNNNSKAAMQLALNQRSTGLQVGSPVSEIRRRPMATNKLSVERLPPRPVPVFFPSSGLPPGGIVSSMPLMTRSTLSGPVSRLARPILPKERTVMDRLVEYLVGDGVNQRFALICRNCHSHNGMALREEFEYLAFRCCYCHHWNPARKQRLQAPRLKALPASGNTTTSSSQADSNTEDEDVQPSQPHIAATPPDVKKNKSEVHDYKLTSSEDDTAAKAEPTELFSSIEAEFESLVSDSPIIAPGVNVSAQ